MWCSKIDNLPGRVAQSDVCLIADPGVASSIRACRSHTFVEIDHEISSTVILLLTTESSNKQRKKLTGAQ